MNLLDDITLGRYVPGDSPVHRLDPRIKLAVFPLLVIASFAFHGSSALMVMVVVAIGLTLGSRISWRLLLRGIMPLRWFLMISLLLHLFLSPGHTLFGIPWLSKDGLFQGLEVGAHLLLAIWFSSLLTLTTKPLDLARAWGALSSPFRRFGFPDRETAQFLLLVLQFIPIFREEVDALKRKEEGGAEKVAGSNCLAQRLRMAGDKTAALILQVVERTDLLAREMASGGRDPGTAEVLEPFPPLSAKDIIVVGAGLFMAGMLIGLLP